jgi:hypothetical protein
MFYFCSYTRESGWRVNGLDRFERIGSNGWPGKHPASGEG